MGLKIYLQIPNCSFSNSSQITLATDPSKVVNKGDVCPMPDKCVPKRIKGSTCENPCSRTCATKSAAPEGGLGQDVKCSGKF